MKENEVLQFIAEKRDVSFTSIYKKFHSKTPQEKRFLKKMVDHLQKQGTVMIHPITNRITMDKIQEDHTHQSHKKERRTRPHHTFSPREKKSLTFGESDKDLSLIKEKYQLPDEFSADVLREIENEVWKQQVSQEKHRQNLSDLFVITIDGADSKDLDDAVSISKSFFGGWELGVHIADVSYYVPKGSPLDQEAYQRANSYYFINKVTPMLPQTLSNDLCSLNPHEEKKSMSIFISFDNQGNMKKYRIIPSVIKTSYRMTYDRVEEILNGAEEKDAVLAKNIKLMGQLYRILHQKRMKKGSVDFNFKEKKIILDENDIPTKIYQKDRLDSERLIEEFMLSANQIAGEFLSKNGLGLYRVHDIPPQEKYQRLRTFAAKRGYQLPDVPVPKDLQDFINSLIDSPVQMSGEIITLRSMAQAVYQQENIGHFGLGFDLYAHFTSPIRRYADLVVHRLIKYYLFKDKGGSSQAPYTKSELDTIGSHISAQERIAMEAERDLFKIKSVRYMKPFEGERFQGTVSSVAHFGIFVEEPQSGIEAMIRYTDMKEYIVFHEDELRASNRSRTKNYQIGMPIHFRIVKVNVERGFIDAEEVDI